MNKLVLFAALFTLSAIAFAEEELKPAQEEAKAKFDEAMEDPLKALNEKCGTTATMKTDFQNFKESEWANTSYPAFCKPVLSTIASMCESRPAYKKIIGKKLTQVQCIFAGVKPKEKKDGSNEYTLRNMSFEKGAFVFRMHKDQSNIDDNVRTTMEKSLN